MEKYKYFGIDGCSAGWILVWKDISNPEIMVIDIPIGLKNEGPEPRECDKMARKNKQKTEKGLSKQTWYISDKIKEVEFSSPP
ncbi:MAG: DUF429 domain-containing protein [Promethearchaeia archaeon]